MNATIKLLSSNSMRAVLDELLPQFERATGERVATSYDPAKAIERRIGAGETPDAVLCGPAVLKALAERGSIVAESIRPLARCGVGVAVRAGAAKPCIGTVDAFRRALLDAKSVAYTQEGASGMHFSAVIEKLGIAGAIDAKAVRQAGGLIAELVVAGKAELAIQQIPELLAVRGVELVGPLPDEVQAISRSAIALHAAASQKEGAQALIEFLTTPAAKAVFTAKGHEVE